MSPTRRSCSRLSANGRPNKKIRPAVGRIKPAIIDNVVVLPAPFGPRRPTSSPRAREKLRLSTAVRLPNRFVSPSTTRIVSLVTESAFRRAAVMCRGTPIHRTASGQPIRRRTPLLRFHRTGYVRAIRVLLGGSAARSPA